MVVGEFVAVASQEVLGREVLLAPPRERSGFVEGRVSLLIDHDDEEVGSPS